MIFLKLLLLGFSKKKQSVNIYVTHAHTLQRCRMIQPYGEEFAVCNKISCVFYLLVHHCTHKYSSTSRVHVSTSLLVKALIAKS